MKRLTKILLGLDQLGNTILGGYPDETMSAHAGRTRHMPGLGNKLFWRPLAWALDKIQSEHVEQAILHEEDGSQNDPAYRKKDSE